MFSSNIYPLSYTKNKSKEFYCLYYAVKFFLHFFIFHFPPFQCLSCISCHVMTNFCYFLGGLHVSGCFIFRDNTWKRHYRQLQVSLMISNKKKFLQISQASSTPRTHYETFWALLINVSKTVCAIAFSFALISN